MFRKRYYYYYTYYNNKGTQESIQRSYKKNFNVNDAKEFQTYEGVITNVIRISKEDYDKLYLSWEEKKQNKSNNLEDIEDCTYRVD